MELGTERLRQGTGLKKGGEYMIRLAVVEDEDSFAVQLQENIRQYSSEKGTEILVTRYRDGDEIAENYSCEFDIILMDIQMRFMDGMTAAEKIREKDKNVIIVFITNRIDYAIRGYGVDALDYIVKPVEYFSFSKKLERAIDRVHARVEHTVTLQLPGGFVRLKTDEIYYVESENHTLIYHTMGAEYRLRARIADAEEELFAYGFFRCNKGLLVNLQHVKGIQDNCCLVQGKLLVISRGKKTEFMAALANYMGER